MYLQSIKSVKHNAAKSVIRSILKKSRHIGFGVFILHSSMPPNPLVQGEGHTRWRERGWESPNSDEGTYSVVLFICMYFVSKTIGRKACESTLFVQDTFAKMFVNSSSRIKVSRGVGITRSFCVGTKPTHGT
jgi:hypothetical protein